MIVSVILAAGEGTRMKSKHSKVTQTLLNRPMIDYVVSSSEEAGVEKNIVIVGKNIEQVKNIFQNRNIIYKTQNIGPEFPYGTGYAVSLAVDEIADDDDVLILNGDIPLLSSDSLSAFIKYHKESGLVGTLLTAIIEDPTNYGRIIKNESGHLIKIVEHRDANEEELKIHEFNPGVYIFRGSLLKESLKELDTDNDQGELYITDVVEILAKKGHILGTFLLDDVDEVHGINSKDQLSEAEEILRKRINTKHMKNGVIMENPSNIFIEPGVKIGMDTRIYSGAKILGKTVIGEDCIIDGGSTIIESEIEDNVQINRSVIEYSKVFKGATIGPFAHLRPKSEIGQNVHIGNFVETKNTKLGENTKAGHLAYIGDADLGKNINIGCGVIFVNFDGKDKFRSTIKDGAFIGSNSNVISPVTIEEDAFIAAGTSVTKDVEKGALFISRAESRSIADWVYIKRKKNR
ncbi:bifunctional UDP-N-acetylglucosamine diphosphorylase/glucosamine-1-phosphate N-acetyltransferase GlmU [Microaceticoccus formicicus]|uniref:bifunctional UDP-N-acetylglucosamine diphosphorylase/glucosamine-1-phosphate N-acetyltransferase GlmU n=1 Tax=Microaceticoccus formicicus TaxID=3118105 RepID=UPI003CD04354|nr:bifunctional UDP-N-acetylglucosamine diphosphorylase/glucosamine-1-phosphate N-acetyltransferase GlmU [Peptoniphilaceae bacterium AMB_02]